MLRKQNNIKKIFLLLIFLVIKQIVFADIAPMPIVIKSINTNTPCDIQMVKEFVNIKLFPDSSIVECEFYMKNHGDSISLPIGFPVMNFSHWGWNTGKYTEMDLDKFQIIVDDFVLTKNEIYVPNEMDSIYNAYMEVYLVNKRYKKLKDSIYDFYGVVRKKNGKNIYPKGTYKSIEKELEKLYNWREKQPSFNSDLSKSFREKMKQGNYLWYVWDVNFKKGESKTIKVTYKLPTGIGYGADYRYVEYLLNTGKGWKDEIVEANINIELIDVKFENIEEIKPSEYHFDTEKKIISWKMKNIEPTTDHDIYVRYFNPKERKEYEKYIRKKQRRIDRYKRKEKSTAL